MTIPSVLATIHICLDVLLHQLAAINTSPPSTCVQSSGIWAALSEVCRRIIRISAGTLSPSRRTLIHPRWVSAFLGVFFIPSCNSVVFPCTVKNLSAPNHSVLLLFRPRRHQSTSTVSYVNEFCRPTALCWPCCCK